MPHMATSKTVASEHHTRKERRCSKDTVEVPLIYHAEMESRICKCNRVCNSRSAGLWLHAVVSSLGARARWVVGCWRPMSHIVRHRQASAWIGLVGSCWVPSGHVRVRMVPYGLCGPIRDNQVISRRLEGAVRPTWFPTDFWRNSVLA